jgi:hypothetical protein
MRWTFALLLILSALAGTSKANTGLTFLTFSSLPRGTALGEAFTAASGDLTAAGYNPAGLAGLGQFQFAFMHKAWVQDIYLNYGALAFPYRNSLFHWSLTVSTAPGIELRDAPTSEPLGIFDANDVALSFGWAKKIRSLDVGLTGKWLYEKIYTNSATGWGVDLGAQYGYRDFRFGASILNLGPDMKFQQEDFSIPAHYRLGAAYLLPEHYFNGNWLILADFVKPKGFDPYLNLGMEYSYEKRFFARLGYKGGEANQSDFAFGLGVKYKKYTVDYSYIPFKLNLGSSHQIAFMLGL